MRISPGRVVTLVYAITTEDEQVVDLCLTDEPLRLIWGGRIRLLAEVEAKLLGLEPGAIVTCRLEPGGATRPDARLTVPRAGLPEGVEPRPGVALRATRGDARFPVWIREVRGDSVVLDPRHPRAGVAWLVRVEVREVRVATAEELASGEPAPPTAQKPETRAD
jgi:FKBP-type peptidyl-prolyl cis-trans isomerase SlyD